MAGMETTPQSVDVRHEPEPIHLDGGEEEARLRELVERAATQAEQLPKSNDTADAREEFNYTLYGLRFLLKKLDEDNDTSNERLQGINRLYKQLYAKLDELQHASTVENAESDRAAADATPGDPDGVAEEAGVDHDAELRREREHLADELRALEERARERGISLDSSTDYMSANFLLGQVDKIGDQRNLAALFLELADSMRQIERYINERDPEVSDQPKSGGGGAGVDGGAAAAAPDAAESAAEEVAPITPEDEGAEAWQSPEGYADYQEKRTDSREQRKNSTEFQEWRQSREVHETKTREYERALEDYYKEMNTLRLGEAWRLQRTGGKLWRKMTGIKPELSDELKTQRSEMLQATEDYTKQALSMRQNRTPSMEYEPKIEGNVRERVLERLPEAERDALEQQLTSLSPEDQQKKLAEVRREQVMSRYQRQLANKTFTNTFRRQLNAQERAFRENQWLAKLPMATQQQVEAAKSSAERSAALDDAVREYVRKNLSPEEVHRIELIRDPSAQDQAWKQAEAAQHTAEQPLYKKALRSPRGRLALRVVGAGTVGSVVGLTAGVGAAAGAGAALTRSLSGAAGGALVMRVYGGDVDRSMQAKQAERTAEADAKLAEHIREIEKKLRSESLSAAELESIYDELNAIYGRADAVQRERILKLMGLALAGGLMGASVGNAAFAIGSNIADSLPDAKRADPADWAANRAAAADETDAWARERAMPPEPESAPEGPEAEAVDDVPRAESVAPPEAQSAVSELADLPEAELRALEDDARALLTDENAENNIVGRFALVAIDNELQRQGLDGVSVDVAEMRTDLAGYTSDERVALIANLERKIDQAMLGSSDSYHRLATSAVNAIESAPSGEGSVIPDEFDRAAGFNDREFGSASPAENSFVTEPPEANKTGFAQLTDEQLQAAIEENRERVNSEDLNPEANAAAQDRLSRLLAEDRERAAAGDVSVIEVPVELQDPRADAAGRPEVIEVETQLQQPPAAGGWPEVVEEETALQRPPADGGEAGEEASQEAGPAGESEAGEGVLDLSEPIAISLGEGAGEARISLRVTGWKTRRI